MAMPDENQFALANLVSDKGVEIMIALNGAFIWVNVDGVCALRIRVHKAANIKIEDMRK